MSWERFHFYCRDIKKLLENGLDVETSYEKSRNNSVSEEFGEPIKSGTVSDAILRELSSTSRDKKGAVEKAFEIYGKLNFSMLHGGPNKLRRVNVYLSYLVITFLFMSAIYMNFVTPVFESFFESMDLPAPSSFVWFSDNWWLIIVSISICLAFSLLLSMKINGIFKFDKTDDTSVIYKYFIPGRLKEKHKKIIWLVNLPISISEIKNSSEENYLINYFKNNNHTNSEIASELSILITNNMRDLVLYSESFIQKIFVTIALLIIFGIFQFLSSAYAPIFVMGNAV